MKLLQWAGVETRRGKPDGYLDMVVPSHPGRFRVQLREQPVSIGIWTGRCYDGDGVSPDLGREPMLLSAAALGRRVQRILRADVRVGWASSDTVVHVEPLITQDSGVAHVRSVVVDHFAGMELGPEAVCLDATGYLDVDEPTPLSLEVFQARWGKRGGVPRALRRFGVVIDTGTIPGYHLVALGRRVYRDTQSETRLLKKDPLRWFSAPIIEALVRLQLWGASAEASVRIEPGARARIGAVEKKEGRSLSIRKQARNVVRALDRLTRGASVWPALTVFLHEMTYVYLKNRCRTHGLEAEHVIAEAMTPRPSGRCERAGATLTPLPRSVRNALRRWHLAEQLRRDSRILFQREWSAVWRLLRRLGDSAGLGCDIVYLRKSEIARLKRRESICIEELREIAHERAAQWRAQAIELPVTLSVVDFECLDLGSLKSCSGRDAPGSALVGVWAAGGNESIEGVVRNLANPAAEVTVGEDEIALVHHLDPVTTLSLKSAAAVIAEAGGVLSHAAILAREIGLPLIIGVQNACAALEDGEYVRIQPDGNIVRKGA